MYTEVNNRPGTFNDRADYVSPLFRQAGKTCKFTFWYHMYGQNIGYLRVYLRRNGRDTNLLSLLGNKGNSWKQGSVNIPSCATDFRVSSYYRTCAVIGEYKKNNLIARTNIVIGGYKKCLNWQNWLGDWWLWKMCGIMLNTQGSGGTFSVFIYLFCIWYRNFYF